jgi:tetratricopeptide (TPR) repeat protein
MVRPRSLTLPLFSSLLLISYASGQTAAKPAPDASAGAEKAVKLAASGHCGEALPLLRSAMRAVSNQELKRKAELAGVRCAMTLGRPDTALDFLGALTHDFPHDPDVLYAEVHAFSDLGTEASQTLAQTAPSSPQAHELLAESYEMQGKWDAAEKEYRGILEQNPEMPGIHFRLGRLLLSRPDPPATAVEDSKKYFEQELAIDPSNAGAEYVLGELARQSQNEDEAVLHFSRATKLDPKFAAAFLGLGISLVALKRYSDALSPLETAVRLEPGNPDAHYNLATAYTRSGHKQEAQREFAIQQQLISSPEHHTPKPQSQ